MNGCGRASWPTLGDVAPGWRRIESREMRRGIAMIAQSRNGNLGALAPSNAWRLNLTEPAGPSPRCRLHVRVALHWSLCRDSALDAC